MTNKTKTKRKGPKSVVQVYVVKRAQIHYLNTEVKASSPEEALYKESQGEGKELGLEFWNHDGARGVTVEWNKRGPSSWDSKQFLLDEEVAMYASFEAEVEPGQVWLARFEGGGGAPEVLIKGKVPNVSTGGGKGVYTGKFWYIIASKDGQPVKGSRTTMIEDVQLKTRYTLKKEGK